MVEKFHLQIVTPDRIFLDEQVQMAVVRTVVGDVGLLRDHILMVAPLNIGIIKIKRDGQMREATISGGFVQVDEDKTTIITDAAEWPEEIDIDRAMEAKNRAEKRLEYERDQIDVARAEIALKKANMRIETYNSSKNK